MISVPGVCTIGTMNRDNTRESLLFWRVVFAAAALWTALGAVPGMFDAAATFRRFYGFEPESELVLELFRGAWGQSLLFALGYLVAVIDPRRHAALLLLGVVGKAVYAVRLFGNLIEGEGGSLTVAAVVGDALFVALFAIFLLKTGALLSLLRPTPVESP